MIDFSDRMGMELTEAGLFVSGAGVLLEALQHLSDPDARWEMIEELTQIAAGFGDEIWLPRLIFGSAAPDEQAKLVDDGGCTFERLGHLTAPRDLWRLSCVESEMEAADDSTVRPELILARRFLDRAATDPCSLAPSIAEVRAARAGLERAISSRSATLSPSTLELYSAQIGREESALLGMDHDPAVDHLIESLAQFRQTLEIRSETRGRWLEGSRRAELSDALEELRSLETLISTPSCAENAPFAAARRLAIRAATTLAELRRVDGELADRMLREVEVLSVLGERRLARTILWTLIKTESAERARAETEEDIPPSADDPRIPAAYMWLGDLYVADGQLAQAKEAYHRAVAQGALGADAFYSKYSLEWIAWREGDRAAIGRLRELVESIRGTALEPLGALALDGAPQEE
ncbi:MAG: hypothetical protein HY791_15155 [Deltaproteobacteria bacterium]|nr:hypothetical protein [Deltaproteobacteria bacterium]